MTPSPRIADFIRGYEKLRLKAYAATEAERAMGIWTIGYGHTLGVKEGDVWDEAKADTVFAADLAEFAKGVAGAIGLNTPDIRSIPPAPATTQAQFDAMTSLAFNIGLGNFRASSVLTNHRAGHYQTAAYAFSLWNRQRGADGVLRVLNGLTARRAAEAGIYQGR